MSIGPQAWLGVAALCAAGLAALAPASAQPQPQKPNILFIMGDDIGSTSRRSTIAA